MKSHFSEEDIQITNKYMKRCSTLSAMRKIQIETMRHYYTSIRMAKIQNRIGTTSNAVEDVEKTDSSYIAGGNVNEIATLEKFDSLKKKSKHATPI